MRNTLTMLLVLLTALPCWSDEAGPPAPLSREEVLARSFPGFVPREDVHSRMKVSRAVGISLFACDAISTFTSKGHEKINPLAFGSKTAGVILSGLSTLSALRAEEKLYRSNRKGWANAVRWTRWGFSAAACGWNIKLSF